LAYNLSAIACGPLAGSIKVVVEQTFNRWAQPFPRTRMRPERRIKMKPRNAKSNQKNWLSCQQPAGLVFKKAQTCVRAILD
jgi:hypothetical protein